MSSLDSAAKQAFAIADDFLGELGASEIDEIYLIGSVVEGSAGESSDIDFLIVGEDFDDVEDERIAMAESGDPFPGLDIDVAVSRRKGHLDIIFSSSQPRDDQVHRKLYDTDQGGWLI